MGFLYRRRDSRLWWVCWSDITGERRRESTGLTDLEAARKVLEDLEARVAAKRKAATASGPAQGDPAGGRAESEGLLHTLSPEPASAPLGDDLDRQLSNDFTRAELERLLSDERVDRFRRCQWAVLALTGARIGEVLGLRVRHCDLARQPLGRLLVTGRWDSKLRRLTPPRCGLPREVPVHKTLAAMLQEHLRAALPIRLGRAADPDDLLFPAAGGSPQQAGTTLAHLQRDLETVGLRKGNLHTLRRTFFSLGRQDGAAAQVLRLISEEGRPGDPDMPFPTKCAEIARLDVQVARGGGGPSVPAGPAGPYPPPRHARPLGG